MSNTTTVATSPSQTTRLNLIEPGVERLSTSKFVTSITSTDGFSVNVVSDSATSLTVDRVQKTELNPSTPAFKVVLDSALVVPTLGNTKYIAGGVLSGHMAVALSLDGTVHAASADVLADRFVLGITLNAANAGGQVEVISHGLIEHMGWTFTPGDIVALGLNGALVQSVPGTAKYFKPIGVALSPTKISIDLQSPIIL